MITTVAAAAQAGVAVATIRIWCRRGVVAATKASGRWVIDAPSLAHRIEIGTWMMDRPTTRYTVAEGTDLHGYKGWQVVRTDGTKAGFGGDTRISRWDVYSREDAEAMAAIIEALPDAYWVRKEEVRFRSVLTPDYWAWRLYCDIPGDPKDIGVKIDVTRSNVVEVLVREARAHLAGSADRIREKAEREAIAAAEALVREAREAEVAEVRAEKGPLATGRQVEYILQLLVQRERDGEGGGFFSGPTDRAGIEMLSRLEASRYITSLKGDY